MKKEQNILIEHECKTIDKSLLPLISADFIDKENGYKATNPTSFAQPTIWYGTGRLANTGYVSILPVDKGIERILRSKFANIGTVRLRKYRKINAKVV